MDSDQGKETLGVILAPDSNNDLEFDKLKEKARTWSDCVLSGHLTVTEARLALDTTIMRTLSFPLPALNLSEPECIKIMKPVLDASLAKTRVSRHFPQAVIYGPKQEKGLGYFDLFLQQGLSHISIIQQHLNAKTIAGSFLCNSIKLMKIEIGLGHNLFSLDYEVYSTYATDCWIKSTWEFSYIHHINIEESVTSNVILRRQNDAYIMEAITNLQRYSKAELNHINRCCLYLQVTTLSDITTACG